MMIYKVFRAPEWAALEAEGSTRGAPVDLADGFVHLSTAEQLAETLARHFGGVEGLVLAAVSADGLANLRWEVSRGGAQFPHLYAPLKRTDVVWTAPLPLRDGVHVLPGAVE
ncbi:MAG: DUF952 domain-containing protein [Paracoccaceae bacterium]